MPQIEAFAASNPSVPIDAQTLVSMIVNLQRAMEEAAANGNISLDGSMLGGDDMPDVTQILSDSSQMSGSDAATSSNSSNDDDQDDDEDDSSEDRHSHVGFTPSMRSESLTLLQRKRSYREQTPKLQGDDTVADDQQTPGTGSSGTRSRPFPSDRTSSTGMESSEDEVIGKDYAASRPSGPSSSNAQSAGNKRRTSSQDLRSQHPSSEMPPHVRKVSRDRKISTSALSIPSANSSNEGSQPRSRKSSGTTRTNEEKEVLRGKGRARAPPSAWTRPKPQALANRRRTSEASSSPGSIASSPQTHTFGLDLDEGPIEDLGAALLGQGASGVYSSPEVGSADHGSRRVSPAIDESTFHPFALSPTGNALGTGREDPLDSPSRVSHGQLIGLLPRGLSSPDIHGYDESIRKGAGSVHTELVTENEKLRREKKELQNALHSKDDETESMAADLHHRVEALEEALATKKKEEKAARAQLQECSEQLVGMEAELTAAEKRQAALKETITKNKDQIELRNGKSDISGRLSLARSCC